MIRVGLLGSQGRMGDWVTRLLASEFASTAQLIAAVGRKDRHEPLLDADVVIDFSLPEAMTRLVNLALARPLDQKLPAFVVGSTGWKPEERTKLETHAARTPVLMASNFSTGVLALVDLLKNAAPLLAKLGYTPVIVEGHHRHKKDAPSGTAITLQRAISPEHPGQVQTHSVRAGEVIGDHEVTFYGPGDHLVMGHFAQDRSIFARGAIDVALWLSTQRNKAPVGLIGIENFFEEVKTS